MALVPAISSQSIWKFSPQSIPGCVLWLDGADANTMFTDTAGTTQATSGQTVKLWKDKSVNAYNATQSTTGNAPTVSSSGLVFTNSAKTSLITSYSSSTAPETAFAVVTPSSTVVNPTNTAFTITSTSNGSANIVIGSRRNTSSVLTNNVVQFTGITQTTFGLSNGVNYYIIGDTWTTGTTSTITLGLIPTTVILMSGIITTGTGLMNQSYFTITGASNGSSSIAIGSRTNTTNTLTGSIITFSTLSVTTVGLSNNVLYYVLSDDWVSPNTTSHITLTITPYSSTPITMTGSTTTTSQCTCMFGYNILGSTVSSGRNLSIYGGKLILTGSLTSNPTTCMTSTIKFTTNRIAFEMLYVTNTLNANSFYMDGTVANSGSSNVAIDVNSGTSIIGSQNTSSPFGFDGTIHEIVVYNSTFTTTQRQQVEGYLEWKWGLQSNLPVTHPYNASLGIMPFARTFLPTDISGCALWLDGADANTLTLSGSNVSQWNDKSGNARNAITPVGTVTYNASPINNTPTITFAAGGYLLNTMTYTSTSRNVFAVVTIGDYGPSVATTYTIISTSSGSIGIQVYSYTKAGTLTGDIEMNYSGKVLLATISGVGGYYNTTSILATTNSTGNSGIFVNGSPTTLQTDSTGSATYTTGSVTQYIGGSGTQPTIIGELIVYDASMTTVQRQQVEGYLSKKWGLTSSLPITHPFKYYPPSTPTPFNPLTLASVCLWMDAADTSTITGTTSVTQWNDKSGNGCNMAPGSYGSPSYNSTLRSITYSTGGSGLITLSSKLVPVLSASGVTGSLFFVGSFVWSGSIPTFEMLTVNNYAQFSSFFSASNAWTIYDDGTGVVVTPGYTFVSGTTYLVEVIYTSSTSVSFYINGAPVGTTPRTIPAAATAAFTTSQQWAQYSYYSTGSMNTNEIILVNGTLSIYQRQQVEGYLGWKWGITLPTTHPYYKFSP